MRKEYDELVDRPGASTRSSPSSSRSDARPRPGPGAPRCRWSSAPTAGAGRARRQGRVLLPGPGDRRVQRAGRHRRPLPDRQRLRRQRPGLRRRRAPGRTVGTTTWADDPVDVESLAPAGPGEVWVGDTGDNRRGRDSITVLRVPYGATDQEVTPAAYELVYPDRAHDAETLMANPQTGQLFVVSKDIFGGTIYAAPRGSPPTTPTVYSQGCGRR